MRPVPPSSEVEASSPGVAEALAGAILTVDLGAVRANYRLLRNMSAPATCGAVVKANAYGLGAARIAPVLAEEGCRSFFVAHWVEALALRPLLPADAKLFVLNGLPAGSEALAAGTEGIVPVLNSVQQLEGWAAAARARREKLPAVLHVDTGLSRFGIPRDALPGLIGGGLPGALGLLMVMSHLACADEPEHPANAAQLAAFGAVRKMLPGVPASLANSSGIFLGEDYRFDGVRAGAALYGISPVTGRPNPMQQAVQLQARVMQVRDLPAGSGIGYGHDFVAPGPLRTATVGLGYADGWPRRARAGAFYRGKKVPVLGRVSMDSIVLDISGLEAAIEPGSLMEFLGEAQTPDELAGATGTIGYEILTGLGHRPFRRYVETR